MYLKITKHGVFCFESGCMCIMYACMYNIIKKGNNDYEIYIYKKLGNKKYHPPRVWRGCAPLVRGAQNTYALKKKYYVSVFSERRGALIAYAPRCGRGLDPLSNRSHVSVVNYKKTKTHKLFRPREWYSRLEFGHGGGPPSPGQVRMYQKKSPSIK